jgi:hypothetical protein
MCTEKDCRIFRGMLIACDACERAMETQNQTLKTAPEATNSPSVR